MAGNRIFEVYDMAKKKNMTDEEKAAAKARSLACLNPPKHGEVRNPWGRWGKKGIEGSFKGMLHKILFDDEIGGKIKAEMLMEALFAKAMEGDTKAIDMIMDRYEGKVKDTVKVESDDGLACMILPSKRPKEDVGEE